MRFCFKECSRKRTVWSPYMTLRWGIWANFWTGDGDRSTRNFKIMWNATKYKYVILLLEITYDSKKITKTSKRYNIYAFRQQQCNSFTKKKTYFDGHLEVYISLSLEDPQGVRSSTLLRRHLRRMNWREDILFNRINVKLKCAVLTLSNIFSHSDILNFETNLLPIVPPAKMNSCKSFNLK